jgi:polyhydroxyalkanoate synthesis repressor PhaR
MTFPTFAAPPVLPYSILSDGTVVDTETVAVETMAVAPRIIKKYLNRRLYDTATSKFLTLDGVRQLVVDGTPIEVIDVRTGEILTRHILLQIIGEQEEKKPPLLSTEILTNMIRLYGDSERKEMSQFLQRNLELFLEQQELFRRQTAALVAPGTGPAIAVMSNLTDMARRNLDIWRAWQTPFERSDPRHTPDGEEPFKAGEQ